MAAQPEPKLPGLVSDARSDLYQFQPDCIDLHFTHGLWKRQTPEPVKQVVSKAMQLEPIGIHNHGGRTDRAKIEAVLSFLDEVFHSAAVAVEAPNAPIPLFLEKNEENFFL